MFWGPAIDPDKTRQYEVPNVDDILPPKEAPMRPVIISPTATKQHPKPTSHLPPDHGTKEGENSKPVFGDPTSTPTSTATRLNPTPDEGWFSDMSSLISNQKWIFGGLALLVLFGVGVGLFFYLRKRRTMSAYDPLGTNEMSMSALAGHGPTGGTGRSRELYDAFGEVSDDEDEADENTGLRRPQVPGRSTEGLGFNSGFLDDEDPATTGGVTPKPQQQHYRDDSSGEEDTDDDESEEKGGEDAKLINPTGGHSSSTSTSGEGSWEHASTSIA